MSQHHFYVLHDNEKTHILMGWDRLLRGFFLVIEKESDVDDEPYWSNLNITVSHPKTLQPFLDVLAFLHLRIPEQMIDEMEEDRRLNVGNKNVIHRVTEEGYTRLKQEIEQDIHCDFDLHCSNQEIITST